MAGLYCIYKNKEIHNKPHLSSYHAVSGAVLFVLCVGFGLVGSVVLHPDFGVAKTNKQIRMWHKVGARLTLIFTWFTAILGLSQLAPTNVVGLIMYGLPLFLLIPFVLM